MDEVIAHIKCLESDCSQWMVQTLNEHAENVATLASKFVSEFNDDHGLKNWGIALGLLHDIGKADAAFQHYIKVNSGYESAPTKASRHPHALIGAYCARKIYGKLGSILSYCIYGHHRGLPDIDYLQTVIDDFQRINPNFDKDRYKAYLLKVPTFLSLPSQIKQKDLHLWVRMLFSALVDADRLDTEAFMTPEQTMLREKRKDLKTLLPNLENYLSSLKGNVSPLNSIRMEIQDECRTASVLPVGFYSLTVPTGGGKTLSSLLWAMLHAIKHDLRRVIIAIPYTSIIVQTASILRSVFGAENVLEHHSLIEYNDDESDGFKDGSLILRLATENWDFPIVVTTNVQLFESIFSNKPGKCRKLHNLARSVIILDEVQTLPLDFMQPIIDSLETLHREFGTSVIFTTASQPAIARADNLRSSYTQIKFQGLNNVHEIVPDPDALSNRLRRAEIKMESGLCDYADIANRIRNHNRVLCIVNTRKAARKIFDSLQDSSAFHLSRMMCPEHIANTLNEIKCLLNDTSSPVKVVSTQLVEAGVDIDFPVVFREKAGLDSIVQAAGRCNREGKMNIGYTYVFETSETHTFGLVQYGIDTLKHFDSDTDWLSPDVMKQYFKRLYMHYNQFDVADIEGKLSMKGKSFDPRFEEAAEAFKLIEDTNVSVVVNYGKSMDLVSKLKEGGPTPSLVRNLNRFCVGIPRRLMLQFMKDGIVEEIMEGFWIVADRAQYDEKVGLLYDNHWLDEIAIV